MINLSQIMQNVLIIMEYKYKYIIIILYDFIYIYIYININILFSKVFKSIIITLFNIIFTK